MTLAGALRLSVVAVCGTACASGGAREPDVTSAVVRTTVAPNETVDLTHQTLLPSQEFGAPRAPVWAAVLASADDIGMPVESADSTSGKITFALRALSPRIAGHPAAQYIDCGQGPGGTPRVGLYQLNLRLTTHVESVLGGRTLVHAGLVATAQDRATTADQLPCTSSGQFERRVLAIIAAHLSSNADAPR